MSPDKSRRLTADVSERVWEALRREVEQTGEPVSHLVDRALREALGLNRHALFQVSTSGALVQGVFTGVVTVAELKSHGDFGLGTFEDLDGELVLLDGQCVRVTGGGAATVANDQWSVPFAVATRFDPDQRESLPQVKSIKDLTSSIDSLRPSQNHFVGIRVEGVFEQLMLRAACKAAPGENLVQATDHQSEFTAGRMTGTLVGFWTPEFAKTVNVPGYHFHFISSNLDFGGHVLEVSGADLDLALHIESDLHIALPENEKYRTADLSGDHTDSLRTAESALHHRGSNRASPDG